MKAIPQKDARCRRGFTLVELLVVIAIIGILVALLLPAVQSARESARRTSCLSNLRQTDLALLQYHDVNDRYPPGRDQVSPGRFNGFFTLILPYLEDVELENLYDYNIGFNDPANQPVTNATVSLFLCPSAPGGREMEATLFGASNGVRAKPTDYFGMRGIKDPVGDNADYLGLTPTGMPIEDGLLNDEIVVSIGKVTDGTSKTIAIYEMAGRPFHRIRGLPDDTFSAFQLSIGPWTSEAGVNVHGYRDDDPTRTGGSSNPGECYINCNSRFGAFSYHPGLIHAMLADGSARSVREDIDALTFVYLGRKSDGMVITEVD